MSSEELPNLDAYHSAIVRIATARTSVKSTPSELLFASVELIAASRPVPDSMPVNDKGIPQTYRAKNSGISIAFRRVAMTAKAAVNWYRNLKHSPTLPEPLNDSDRGNYDGGPIVTATLLDEPCWPSLSTPIADPSLYGSSDDSYPTPFIGPGAYPARIHRQFSRKTELLNSVIADLDLCTWLGRRIHFDIQLYEELLGGAVLVVPDPDVRRVQSFMARDSNGNERLVGSVQSHRGRNLTGLQLTLFEERFGAMHLFRTFDVDESMMIVESNNQLELTGQTLSHVERGLVEQQKALPFLRSINFNMEVVDRQVQIETLNGRRKNSQKETHRISEVSQVSNSIVGFEDDYTNPPDINSRFYEASEKRRTRRVADQQDLQWFDNREIAVKFIREKFGKARRDVMVVDPYADAKDLFDFGHFITNRSINLRLLTSRLPFNDKEEINDSFKGVLRTFAERDVEVPDVRVLRGAKNPPIHDRFLVIDDNVWLSGNSLNTIGERASVMVKLPNLADIRERLERFFLEAERISFPEES